MNAPDSELASALRVLAREVAKEVVRELRDEEDGWIDQAGSPLGARKHCAVARNRMAAGKRGACKVGRRFMLSREALNEELSSTNKPRKSTKAPKVETVSERLQKKLRLVGGDQ